MPALKEEYRLRDLVTDMMSGKNVMDRVAFDKLLLKLEMKYPDKFKDTGIDEEHPAEHWDRNYLAYVHKQIQNPKTGIVSKDVLSHFFDVATHINDRDVVVNIDINIHD